MISIYVTNKLLKLISCSGSSGDPMPHSPSHQVHEKFWHVPGILSQALPKVSVLQDSPKSQKAVQSLCRYSPED